MANYDYFTDADIKLALPPPARNKPSLEASIPFYKGVAEEWLHDQLEGMYKAPFATPVNRKIYFAGCLYTASLLLLNDYSEYNLYETQGDKIIYLSDKKLTQALAEIKNFIKGEYRDSEMELQTSANSAKSILFNVDNNTRKLTDRNTCIFEDDTFL